jgi:hypothetical protein
MVKCGVLFEVRTEFLNKIVGELRLQMVNFSAKQVQTDEQALS